MMHDTAFPRAIDNSKKLKRLFNEYNYRDLAIAFFCISVKRENRSLLENCLSMNQALLDYSNIRCGDKRIDNYQEFLIVFNKIKEILPITRTVDYIIPDYGEVKVIFNGKAYKTFIGTGHTQTFSCLSYLNAVAAVSGQNDILRSVLEYQDEQISFFEKENALEYKEGLVRFDAPSEQLFKKTKLYFDQFDTENYRLIINQINRFKVIEQKHFVMYEDTLLPLFNTSMVIDIITDIISDESILLSAIEVGIYDFLNYIEEFSGKQEGTFMFPAIFLENEKPVPLTKVSFVIKSENRVFVCLDYNLWKTEKTKLRHIMNSHEDGLDLVETRRRLNYKGNLAFHIDKPQDAIKLIVYFPVININEIISIPIENDSDVMFLSALDLINLIQFADDEKEIEAFYTYTTEIVNARILTLAGKAGEFLAWKENGHTFEKGAASFGFINLDYNAEIGYVWDYYRHNLQNYPWRLADDYLFKYPLAWRIMNKSNTIFDEYLFKYAGYGGNITTLGKTVLFFCNNIEFYKEESLENVNHIVEDVLPLVEDIIFHMVGSLNETIENLDLDDSILVHFLFMPPKYYDKVTQEKTNYNYRYVSSEGLYCNSVMHIRFKIEEENLFTDIQNAEDRSIECLVIRELLNPIDKYNHDVYKTISRKLDELCCQEKQVNVFPIEIHYLWNSLAKQYNVNEDSYLWVRKRIALILAEKDVEPGEYYGKDANRIIRTVQKSLIDDFEEILCSYTQYDLQLILESMYSQVIHRISLHRKRYSNIEGIQRDVKNEVQLRIINEREEFKHQKRVLEYLMESNLFCSRNVDNHITNDNLQKIIAYANWLVVLSDNADICFFTENEVHVAVSFEYVIDILPDNEDESLEKLANRLYDDSGYIIKGDEKDQEYYLKAKKAFKEDTGISFEPLVDFLGFLALEIKNYAEEMPNVFSVNKNDIKNEYLAIKGVQCTDNELDDIIDFLTINPQLLKTCNGKTDYYLPIGKRNQRDNRIELKCLWNINDKIIYSPVACYFTKENWVRGTLEFFLPYHIGLNNTVNVLTDWKKRYEDQIVFDVEKCFNMHGYEKVFHNFDPKKMDKSDADLCKLGDYDVLAIDTNNHKIWIIECKMLSKVATFHDMFMQQKSFFKSHKEDEHFQIRINYMKENYHRVLEYLKCDSKDDYVNIPAPESHLVR